MDANALIKGGWEELKKDEQTTTLAIITGFTMSYIYYVLGQTLG